MDEQYEAEVDFLYFGHHDEVPAGIRPNLSSPGPGGLIAPC